MDKKRNKCSNGEDTTEKSSHECEMKDVYLPGQPIEEGEELICDQSAYIILREVQTGAPCLSFDIIKDELGDNRNQFPLTCYAVAGTQASRAKENNIILMKMSNLHKTQEDEKEDSSDDDEDDDEDEENTPRLEYASIAHFGCVNRIRTTVANDTVFAASWSELGRVNIWDLQKQIKAVNDIKLLAKYRQDDEIAKSKPIFTFSGHQYEGFAIDWSPMKPGVLASGDCRKNIHLWEIEESGWKVNQTPLIGHVASVEDLQWSPNEANVLASASVDESIRVWDTRAAPSKACMIFVEQAHEGDVNVIHWNRNDPFIVSGGDDGCVRIWDLRQLQSGKAVAIFKHHAGPVTTVEWHPSEPTIIACGGEDNQISIWDLSVEKDEALSEDLKDVPPQLLFIHQGQHEIKELHWHPQIPGLILSTACTGFNIFKTISV